MYHGEGGSIPFPMLQVTNSRGKHETMARTDRLDNAAGKVVFTSAQVRLIDCVEFASTARNLKPLLEGAPHFRNAMHLLFVCFFPIFFNVRHICRVFYKIGQPGSEFWIIYSAIL